MHGALSAIAKFVSGVLMVLVIFMFITFFGALNSAHDYETKVVKYIQAAGGVTPSVMAKADALSQKSYHGYFKLTPNGSGEPYTTTVTENGKRVKKTYEGVFPLEFSTDHNNTPMFAVLHDHKDQNFEDVTEKGCLMALLDHPNKLFAGQPRNFDNYGDYGSIGGGINGNPIPDKIMASDVKEIKPIGYIDKNYFFRLKWHSWDFHTVVVWPYKLKSTKKLTDQTRPDEYVYDTHDYNTNTMAARRFSGLMTAPVNADDPHVHFNDKSLKGEQDVAVTFSSNNIYGEAYQNNWGDIRANSYPHQYGATIKYNIHISIPYVSVLDMMKAKVLHYNKVKNGSTVSLYREVKH